VEEGDWEEITVKAEDEQIIRVNPKEGRMKESGNSVK
jgi:hypothetical protein